MAWLPFRLLAQRPASRLAQTGVRGAVGLQGALPGRLRGRALDLAAQGRRALSLFRKGLQDALGRGGGRRLPPHAGKGAICLGGHRLEAGLGRGRLRTGRGLGLCRRRRRCLGQMHLYPARRPVQRRQNAVADAVADSPLR